MGRDARNDRTIFNLQPIQHRLTNVKANVLSAGPPNLDPLARPAQSLQG